MASSGNFATLLGSLLYQVGTNTTYSIGNLKYQSSSSGEYSLQASTIAPSSGKWYAEMYVNTVGNFNWLALVGDHGISDTTNRSAYANRTTNGGMGYSNNGIVRYNNSDTSSGYSTYTNGDIIQIAFDIDNTKVWFGKNNTWQNSGDPANGTNASYTNWTTTYSSLPKNWYVAGNIGNTGANTFNFGQDDTFGGVITAAGNADGNGKGVFKYAPPTGFLALCSANLSVSDDIDPALTDDDIPQKQFEAFAYTGTGSSNAFTGLGFKPDLLWIKNRDGTQGAKWTDSSRGTTTALQSAQTAPEETNSGGVTAFGTDGFTVGNNAGYNGSSNNMIAWCWRANGGTTASNSDGATNSVVQANTKSGFSIVTYTGFSGASGTSTVGHGLQKAPEFIITKSRNSDSGWWVQHVGLSAVTKTILLNTNAVEGDYSGYGSLSAPTSSVFSINGVEGIGGSAKNYIAYVWHSVEGFSKFGKYEGNANAEDDSSGRTVDVLSNGFKIRTSNSTINASATYIYGAWGDVPFKYNNTF